MVKKKETNIDKPKALSMDEETLFWTSYRYCIGRKTYVSDMAYFMAKKYYPLLSDSKMMFNCMDIRREMENHFNWGLMFSLHYDGTVNREDRKPYEDYIEFLMTEVVKDGDTEDDIKEKILKIKDVEIYHEHYKEGEPHRYRVTYRPEGDTRSYISPMEFSDYLPWAELASVFDKKHYKRVHINFNGEEKDIICFETWVEDYVDIPERPGYSKWWPWHWKKVYISVDNFIEKGKQAGYLYPNSIIMNIENYDARSEKAKAEDRQW